MLHLSFHLFAHILASSRPFPAGPLCMYVIITDAHFRRIKAHCTHTSLTLIDILLFFFCELMGLKRFIVYSRGEGLLSHCQHMY